MAKTRKYYDFGKNVRPVKKMPANLDQLLKGVKKPKKIYK